MTPHQRIVGELVTALGIGPVPGGWEMAEAALARVEPLIRADERERQRLLVGSMEARHNLALADLRAQIAADIYAARNRADSHSVWPLTRAQLEAYEHAARIARGE